MKLDEIITVLSQRQNGAFIKIRWKSDLCKQMTSEAKRKGFIVTKEVTSIVRKGVRGVYEINNYNGLKTLKTVPLQWGHYYRNSRTIIEHKGKYYLKLFLTKNPVKVQYYVNGTPFDRNEFERFPLLKQSYWDNKDYRHMNDFMIVDIENIEEVY